MINPIHTPCKNCVFASYEDKTQHGCALTYLDIYRKKHIEILEAYDEEKEFYIVNGKKCIGYREPKWFASMNMTNATLEDKIIKYNELNEIDYLAIIDLKAFDKKKLEQTLKDLNDSIVKPKKIIIFRYLDQQNSADFHYSNIQEIIENNKISYAWRMQTILDDSLTQEDVLKSTVGLNSKYRFIYYIKDYSKDVSQIIDKANNIVHKELESFNILSNADKTNILFSTAVYRYAKFHDENILSNNDNYKII
jgi:hypothetical protein